MNKNMKIGLIVGGVILAALVIVHLVAMSTGWEACRTGMTEHRMMGPWMMKGLGGWSMIGIIRLVVIGLIVWLVVSLVRSNQATNTEDQVCARRNRQGRVRREVKRFTVIAPCVQTV